MSTQSAVREWDEHYKTGFMPWDSGVAEPELTKVAAELGLRGKRVLEIGCGTGTNAIWMAQQGAEVLATDLSPTAIEMAKTKAKGQRGLSFACSDICAATPAPANSVEFVFDRGVFHSVPAEARPVFAKRVAEVLRDGGHWLSLSGNADEKREPGVMGPPQLTALEITAVVEPHFQIQRLIAMRFKHPSPEAPQFLGWSVLMRRR
jgi:methyl halide transferase